MCDSVVAVGSETRDGATLFGKNSDRKPGERQPFVQHVAAHHPEGARLRCTHVEIPQVARTAAVMGHRPHWVWGFEHGVNEHAVAIGNHTVFSREPLEETPGLIGMDLVRLGLERGRDAREALHVIAELLARHGQGGPALAPDGPGYHNSFLLADPAEAWVLETSNRRWAARRARRDACSNHYALGSDWETASADLAPFARARGWLEGDGRLDVAAAYRNPHVPGRISEGRHRRTRELLAEGAGAHDVASFQALLRDHDAGGAVFSATDATPEEERFFTVCAHSAPVHETTASLVARLPAERPGPWPVWISFGTPCTGIFLPVYLDGVVPAALARAEGGAFDAFARLQAAAAGDWPRSTPRLREGFAALEQRIERERVAVEAEAREAAAADDRDAAMERVSRFMQRTTDDALACAESLAKQLQAASAQQ